jgi:hypothetical protein
MAASATICGVSLDRRARLPTDGPAWLADGHALTAAACRRGVRDRWADVAARTAVVAVVGFVNALTAASGEAREAVRCSAGALSAAGWKAAGNGAATPGILGRQWCHASLVANAGRTLGQARSAARAPGSPPRRHQQIVVTADRTLVSSAAHDRSTTATLSQCRSRRERGPATFQARTRV